MTKIPNPLEKTGEPFDAMGIPGSTSIPGAKKHQVATNCIGTVFFDQIIGVNHISATFRHLFVIFAKDHALVKKTRCRFSEIKKIHVCKHLGEKSKIEKVHRRVFYPSGVLVYRTPFLNRLWIPGKIFLFQLFTFFPIRRNVAVVIP